VEQEPGFSITWRNLGIAYYNVGHDPERAMACYERAFKVNPGDGRVFSELSQLLCRTGTPAEDRLARLKERLDLVQERDDLSVELATLYNQTGQPQKALDYITSRRFHPWEGGTGRVWTQFVTAHLLLARSALDAGDADRALEHLGSARVCPGNLGERKHLLWPDAHLDYFAGLAKRALGDGEGASASFQRVLEARADDGSGLADTLSDMVYYQALALRALGREAEAEGRLEEMLDVARQRLNEEPERSFADSVPQFVFAEEDLEIQRRTHTTYLIGLAHLGLGQSAEAEAAFHAVLERDPNHTDAISQLRRMSLEGG
jgi:tetratricopeptide (TPR) repeat protein